MRKNTVAAAALLACTVGAKAAAPTQTAAALVDLSLEQLSNVTVSTVSGRAGFDLTPAHRPRCWQLCRGTGLSLAVQNLFDRRHVEWQTTAGAWKSIARFWCSYA